MKTLLVLLSVLVTIVTIQHCSKSDSSNPTSPPPPASGGLTAAPASVRIMPGTDATVSISGGTRPEAIVIAAASGVATVTLADTVLTIHGVAVGGTSVRIGDHSTPQRTVDVGITVATTPVAIMTTAGPR